MRHIYVGTKKWPSRHIVKDFVYVCFEDSGEVWFMDLEKNRSTLMRETSIEELQKLFDRWQDWGIIPDGVRVGECFEVKIKVADIR